MRLGPVQAVVGEMIEARTAAGLTRVDFARLKAAWQMPAFDLLTRYAARLGMGSR